ncbi:O-antigen ligase [Paenibacillus taihuensis]|uniref:O-antigen ligase n=1 Tax=Paenibacillus taihuensis TaxID=1156355 RepID=A0A3D9SMM7_9BACL|nr:O-antigen ligase family protein [Paenibacillus taihuensis]REE92814.1 O-antigen ligase [Paenibacillus taihuensis]
MRNVGLPVLMALLAACVLSGCAYRYGMFFDTDFFRWEWLIIAGSSLDVVVHWIWMPKTERTLTPAYGLLFIALLYVLALVHHPASVLSSMEQALRWTAYGAFMSALLCWFGSERLRVYLAAALHASGLFVIIGALAGWMGLVTFPDIVLITSDSRLSAVGSRLAGFMQYPNFLGAVAGAYLLWFLIHTVRTRRVMTLVVASAGIVPAALVLLLTESRGAWLVTVAGWLVGWWLVGGGGEIGRANVRETAQAMGAGENGSTADITAWTVSRLVVNRMAWLLCSGWMLVCAVFAYRLIVGSGMRGEHATARIGEIAWLVVISAAAVGGFVAWRSLLMHAPAKYLRTGAWGGLLVGLSCVALLLPSMLRGRLSGGYETAGARGLFYHDAWTLIRRAPLLGRGGESWRMLFTQVQSQPYVGNEVHSGYLELALDLGILGLIVFAVIGIVLLKRVWQADRIVLVPIGVLLLHAAVDFDMSFGYYWLLLVGFVVYGMGSERERVAIARLWRRLGLLAAAAWLAAAAVLGVRFDRAVQYREAASAASGSAQAALAALRAGLDANPYWTRIRIELAELAPPPERAVLLAAGLRYEPQSVPLLWALGQLAAERSDVQGAAHYMCLALRYDRFSLEHQTEAVVTMSQLAVGMRAAGRLDDARVAADSAVTFFAAYEAQEQQALGVNSRKFAVTPAAQAAAEQSRRLLLQFGSPAGKAPVEEPIADSSATQAAIFTP